MAASASVSTEISFSDCLSDSPAFRTKVSRNETNLEDLEAKLERVLKAAVAAGEAGKTYVIHQTQFLATLWDTSAYFASSSSSDTTTARLNRLIHAYQEVIKLQNAAVEQSTRAVTSAVSRFLAEDVKQLKDTRGYFNKISTDLDSALQKNAAASPRGRPAEADDAANLLTATRSCFRYTALDYVYQVISTVVGGPVLHSFFQLFLGHRTTILVTVH